MDQLPIAGCVQPGTREGSCASIGAMDAPSAGFKTAGVVHLVLRLIRTAHSVCSYLAGVGLCGHVPDLVGRASNVRESRHWHWSEA